MLYYKTDRLAEAAAFMTEALIIREEVLGPTHPKILTSRDHLTDIQQRLQG